MGNDVLVGLIIGGLFFLVLSFLFFVAAVAVGTIVAHNHIERRAYKEQNRPERKTYKPSTLRAEREARQTQVAQSPPQSIPPAMNTQPPQWK